jgi:glycosyltransferase involved in cell wall biosynthesis
VPARVRRTSNGTRHITVAALIPTLNEAQSIASVLAAIPPQTVDEVIVIDGGSTDNTVTVAQTEGARTILELRHGYGRACARGAAEAHSDVLVFLDGDGADDPAQIPELLQPLLDGQADLVIGSRLTGAAAPGTMPWHQQQGNRIATWCIRRLYGVQLTDLGPFRAIRRQVLLDLDMQDMTYGWPTEMIVKAARSGLRIVETPVHNYPRTAGRSKISGTVRGTVLATWHILGTIARYAAAQGER